MSTCFQKWYQKSGCLIIIYIFFNLLTYAQPFALQAELELNRGLRHNSVRSIIQDDQKRTYLGTESGLIILNSNDSFLDTIAKRNEKLVIVSLNILENKLFIGSASNGLRIYDLKNKVEIHSPFMDSIGYVRHIRKINDEIFIAANRSSWKVKIEKGKVHFTKIHRPFKNGFFTDFYILNKRIFGFDLKSSYDHSKIYEIVGNKAIPVEFPSGFPPNPILSVLTTKYNADKLIIAGDGFYHITNKKGETEYHLLKNISTGLNYPVWDIAITKNKSFLALGQQYLLTAGLTYQINVDNINDIRNDFFGQSLYYDKVQDALWIGTYNRGLFIWPNISSSSKIPISLEGNYKIIQGEKGEYYIYNDENIYKYSQVKNTIIEIADKVYHKTKNEIIEVKYQRDTLAVLSSNDLTFYNNNGDNLILYPFPHFQFTHHRKKGDSIYLFTQHNSGIYVQHKKDKERKVVKGISISPRSKEYKNGFIFFSEERGFYFYDTITHPLKSPLTKIDDFSIIEDQLWTLNAGIVNVFKIDIENGELIEKAEIEISNKIEGFVPYWIKNNYQDVYIGNNKGIIKLDSKSGLPLWYRYQGNYNNNTLPLFEQDSLVFLKDNYIEKMGLKQPFEENVLSQISLKLNRKDGLFERFPIDIVATHNDYFINNYALKRFEISDDKGERKIYYTLSDKISFPSGFIKGKYQVSLFVNDSFVNKVSFQISIPLLENPIFYIISASLIIIFFYFFFRFRNKKQALERNMLENRLQLLKKNLDPHFIFNSLNLTYMLLLQEKNKEAIDSITQFSELHRYFLETINKNQVSLSEELNFIKSYLELEKKKTYIDEPFSYYITPYENELSNIIIPPMLLHPLVENAVKYCGYDKTKDKEGLIRIDIIKSERDVLISIENTLGPREQSNHISFKKGVETVQESIAIYNKMGRYQLKFKASVQPVYFDPGFRCEISLQL
ncbi:MAG: hypothetical protein RL728_871 [Bacteroidota bacterium]|jgi:hypothetical protein